MSRETHRVTVTEKSRIFKFAEGADPTKDEPYEISEFETVHTGDAAIALLENLSKQEGGS